VNALQIKNVFHITNTVEMNILCKDYYNYVYASMTAFQGSASLLRPNSEPSLIRLSSKDDARYSGSKAKAPVSSVE